MSRILRFPTDQAGLGLERPRRTLTHHARGLHASGDFDETKHPRDEKGRFGDGDGSVTVQTGAGKAWLDAFQVDSIRELGAKLTAGIPAGLTLTDLAAGRHGSHPTFTATFGGKGELVIWAPAQYGGQMHLDVIDLPPEAQGQGVAKELLGNLSDYAQETGQAGMSLTANIDVGSYAWAKFGFVPTDLDWKYGFRLRDPIQERLDAGVKIPAESRPIVEQALQSKDPHALWDIVDAPGTFPLLQGTRTSEPGIDWNGRLSFDDKAAMARFNRYIGR